MNNSDPFVNKLKKTLDDQDVDAQTLLKLATARHAALEQQPSETSFLSRYFSPVLALASVALVAIAINLSISPEEENSGMDVFESMDIITSKDDLEMYENLEFYLWLDEQIKT